MLISLQRGQASQLLVGDVQCTLGLLHSLINATANNVFIFFTLK